MFSQRRHWAGFSLVEMVAALTIFSMGVLATMEIFVLCLRSTGTSANYSRAVFRAQAVMEETLIEGQLIPGEDYGELDEELPDGEWTRQIIETDAEGLYEIRVVVSWSEHGKDRAFELTTLAAER